MYLWRYTINMGSNGGIMQASTKEIAEEMLREKYTPSYPDELEVSVWPLAEDDFYDEKFPDVWECY